MGSIRQTGALSSGLWTLVPRRVRRSRSASRATSVRLRPMSVTDDVIRRLEGGLIVAAAIPFRCCSRSI
jgi:hypothetical protein